MFHRRSQQHYPKTFPSTSGSPTLHKAGSRRRSRSIDNQKVEEHVPPTLIGCRDIETTLVHELLHLHGDLFDHLLKDKFEATFLETMIECTAQALVNLKRNAKVEPTCFACSAGMSFHSTNVHTCEAPRIWGMEHEPSSSTFD